jgi:mannose-6-phosphate isomerase-like protein (cupin superfamily)
VFLGTAGEAVAVVGDAEHVVGAGDCLIVPPETTFSLGVPGATPFRALVCLPCGARATVAPDGASFVPPWAQ